MVNGKTRAKEAAGVDPGARVPRPRRIISMRLIISAVTVSLLAVSVIGFGSLAERNARQTLSEEIENRLIVEARNLASLSVDALLTDFPELTLCPLVSEMQAGRQDLSLVAILDHDNLIQGHLDLAVLGEKLPLLADMQPRHSAHQLFEGEQVLADADQVVVTVPARHPNGRQVGTAIVGLSQSYLDEMVARPRRSFLMLTAGLLFAGVAVTLFIMSLLLRPIGALRAGLERIGKGDLASPIRLRDKTELGLLAETVNGMASQLLTSQAQMLEKERLGAEMSLAHQMQHALLPDGEVHKGDFRCNGTYQAAAEVGGDYYDIFELSDGKLGLVIADVSGKGLAGCLVTSMLAVLIRSQKDRFTSPRDLLISLEQGLLSSLAPGTFVTVFYGILDPETGHLRFASAAHSPLAIYRAARAEVEWFYTKGIPIGALRNGALAGTLHDEEIDLDPGDFAMQFTDGLNEAWNPERKEQFGFDRIAQHICSHCGNQGRPVQDTLLSLVEDWSSPDPLGDDFTLLTIQRSPSSAPVLEAPGKTDEKAMAIANHLNDHHGQLQKMLNGAERLDLPSRLEKLVVLRDWVTSCVAGDRILVDYFDLIHSSLFEVCANIIEHGYQKEDGHEINIWWVPLPGEMECGPNIDLALEGSHINDQEILGGMGYFVICDQGIPFDPTSWTPPDLNDPLVRRKGRGLGWQIIYSAMKKVVYEPKTPVGNLTLLRFDPAKHPAILEG